MTTHGMSKPSRRSVIRASGALLAATALPAVARAADTHPPLGTWPDGSSGDSVFIGIAVPRTGTYAVQGEDELKGYQLAVEHINSGDPLIKRISPLTKKGVLGKEVKYGVADSEANPNTAVQAQSRFISEAKAVLMTGSTSSAVAVALNKLAQREKVLYVAGISGSNDTTGKDCVRYGFRQCFYGQTAAAAIGPVLLKNYGKGKKAAYLTPDYTYGHTVQASMEAYLNKNGGWTTVTNQVAPLGAPDYSSYLLNVANSGAEILLNINWGHDAVLSIQQAQQFGILAKQKLVVPYQVPFLAKEVGAEIMQGRLRRDRLLVDARGQPEIPAGENVRRVVPQEIRLPAGMGRQQRLHGVRVVGRCGRARRQLLSARRDQVLRGRQEDAIDRRRGLFPRRRSSARPSGHHRPRQEARGHEESRGFLGHRRHRPGRGPDAGARRFRLPAGRLYLRLRQ